MTDKREAILAKIDETRKHVRFFLDTYSEMVEYQIDAELAPYRALRNQVEKHVARATGFRYSDNEPISYECGVCRVVYPCPTINEVASDLGLKDE